MGAFKIFSRFAELLDIKVTRSAPAWLRLNADGTVSQRTAAETLADLGAGGGGGTKTYGIFTPTHNQPPSSAFATLDTRNSIAVLDFDDTTEEAAVFVGIVPEAASLGSGLKVRIHWMATSATTGNVRWGAQFERGNTDLDSNSFDAAVEATTAVPGTSGTPTVTELTITTIDGLTAGDLYRLRVYRDTSDAADTMTGDAEILAVEVRSGA